MKFSEMPYARPDLDELKQQLQALTDQLKSAPDYASAPHGPRQCSKARSARTLRRNTAI